MARRTAVRDGVEYFVEEGIGHVEKMDRPKVGKQNAHVEIRDPGLKHPIKGWANTHDGTLMACLADALDTGRRIRYRVEVVRNDKQPAGIPMAEVPDKERFRRLVELTPDVQAGPVGPDGPQEAPGGPPPAPAPEPPPEPGSPQEAPGSAESPPSEPPPRRGPRLEEAKPWEPTNSDGSLNLGSYAYGAVLATMELAHELLAAHLRRQQALAAEVAHAGGPITAVETVPTMGQTVRLAKTLLGVADEVQAGIRPDRRVDRMDASHTRARGAMRSALEVYPVPFGQPPEVQAQWRAQLAGRAGELMAAAAGLLAAEVVR